MCLGLDRTTPSLMIPTPSLLALPSKPIAITIVCQMKIEPSNEKRFNTNRPVQSKKLARSLKFWI